jgi:gliding motility-associated-like protein
MIRHSFKSYICRKLKNLLHLVPRLLAIPAKTLAFGLLFLVASLAGKAQLHADFSATSSKGCAPLVVNFNDLSTGSPTSWKWDLGNGTVSLLEDPSTTYFSPGQYSIKLVIRNSRGADSIIKIQFITVYADPQVSFKGAPQGGCAPLPVQFTDLSTAGSGTVSQREWDFGDGFLATVQNPNHTYLSPGNYNVSLRIANNFGCIASLTTPQYIQISNGVKAAFSNTLPAACNQPATIQFSNASTGTGSLSYQWQFGDGGTSLVENPLHTYNIPGSYSVRLVVFNSTGCSDTLTKPNIISIGKVKADFSAPAKNCQGAGIAFTNTSTPVPTSAVWNFGDSTTSPLVSPVKIYNQAGSFTVQMIAGFGGCADTIVKTVQVQPRPSADFTASATVSCKTPLAVSFVNNSPGAVSLSWNFGDGNTSKLANPSHTYLTAGSYTVSLIATNNAGCSTSITKQNLITIQHPVVSIDNLPDKGCVPLTHAFSATVNSVDTITAYNWDFGDGTTSSLQAPSHTYSLPGAYTVTLYYSTSTGCTDTVRVVNGIMTGTKPVAAFSATPTNACANMDINFTDISTGNANQWYWEFGDGSNSVSQNPIHDYGDTGYFSITLVALNNGCPDTLRLPDFIHIKPPIAKFTYSNICTLPGHVLFTDASIGADTWHWDFGDGSSTGIQNPVHDYAMSGTYTVQLTVTNNSTGCSFAIMNVVNALKEVPDFVSSAPAVCKNSPVTFTAVNSIPANISAYTWRFGDGNTFSGPVNSVSHRYTSSGNFNVTLILSLKNGCIDSIVKPLAIKVDGPTAVFKPLLPAACINTMISFVDSSYANGIHSIQQWQWTWGDGTMQTYGGPVFQHAYANAGNYPVSLKVTDNNGCSDSVMRMNAVVISKPVAIFTGDTLSCTSHAVVFVNSSTGPALKYLWNFGDGTTSSQVNPVHLYPKEGRYGISLAITDAYGCTDLSSRMNYIRIANPRANFKASDTAGTCPPLVVNFTNNSLNYFTTSWDFGDGTTSTLASPSHFYSSPGSFMAIMTITGPGGCTDRKTIQIKVKGPTGSFRYSNISGCKPLQTDFKATTQKNTSFIWDFNDGTTLTTPDSVVTHIFKTAGSYLPKMILVDTAGCRVPVMGIDSIKVFEVFASFVNPLSTLCDSGKVAFSNTSSGNDIVSTYLWNFGDNSTSTLSSPVHTYSATGNYIAKLFITSKNGCKDSATMPTPLKVVSSPRISIAGSSGACVPAVLSFSGLISVPDTSALSWKWNFTNGNVSTLQNPPAQTFATAGTYSVTAIATNSSGCSDTVVRMAEAYPLPVLKPTADTVLCLGKSLALMATDAQSYSWSPANYLSCTTCAGPVSRPDAPIKYFVTGKSSKGCIATDSVFIDVKFPNTVKVSKADTLCVGSSVQLLASGAEVYSWSPAAGLNNAGIASPTATPGATITYTVTGSDTKGCFTSTAAIPVKVYPIPQVSAGPDKTINVTQSLQIDPKISGDVTSVNWSPSAGILARNYPGITVKPAESTEYTVEVMNEGGCKARDKISVYVLCDNSNVFMPNTFSPNGDGVNDVFYPRGTGVFTIRSLHVFNRWGEAVFENANFNANDASAGWDGTYKGKKLAPDVFVYALEVLCSNNQPMVFKGNVALIK